MDYEMTKTDNCIITIFGASGDLTKRKLMPALFDLYKKDLLPEKFAVLGTGRTKFSDDSFRDKMSDEVKKYIQDRPVVVRDIQKFLSHLYYHPMDSSDAESYQEFKNRLRDLDTSLETRGNYIYYLATTPKLYETITSHLGAHGLNDESERNGWKRIVFEKPFGFDLQTARSLNAHIQDTFSENQIYRIDHYLGKETVQNILAFRFANGIFEPLWNRNYIHHIEVTAAESIGVEDRGRYYESAGALRDMIQNHLLQVVATVAMEPPSKFDDKSLRDEKVKVFQSLCPISRQQVAERVVRGQYIESEIDGEEIMAYRAEKNVAEDSKTETFAAMRVHIDNWRWGGVPFYIRTGKRLPTRITEVAIHFNKTPHRLFRQHMPELHGDNQLIIRIQPNEGILLRFGMKQPGAGFHITSVDMDFHYKDLGDIDVPDAYERLLLDCVQGDATLYARADAVESCWAFVTPILDAWEQDPECTLYGYPAGSWGPLEASRLFLDSGENWRYPVEALVPNNRSEVL